MNIFMTILRILAVGIVIFCALDYFMDWHLLKVLLPFVVGFLIVYFFASLTQTLIRAKSLGAYRKTAETPEDKDKVE